VEQFRARPGGAGEDSRAADRDVGFFGGLAVPGNPRDLHCFGYEVDFCERSYQDAGTGPIPYGGAWIGFWFH
jgi:hypothetical protein